MSADCPNGRWWLGQRGHMIVGEMRWTTDGRTVMVNRCIRCGEEERAGE